MSEADDIGAKDISTPEIGLLADRLRKLDLCICPDTMVAHLAAALSCDTWIMLHADCDWRWPSSGSATFWYPTVRLFRQPVAGDWCSVVTEIKSALSERATRAEQNDHRLDGSAAVSPGPSLFSAVRDS